MRYRCRDKSDPDYGGRGISVCERWNDFEAFLEDLGERPEGMTLDRIDPDKNYTPENCRWAPPKKQARNTRRARFIHIDGEDLPLMDVAESLGIKKSAMYYYFEVAKLLEEEYGYLPSVKNRRSVAG